MYPYPPDYDLEVPEIDRTKAKSLTSTDGAATVWYDAIQDNAGEWWALLEWEAGVDLGHFRPIGPWFDERVARKMARQIAADITYSWDAPAYG